MPKFKVYIERDNKHVEVSLNSNKSTIRDLLLKLSINPVEVIVTLNNEVCVEDETVSTNDEIKVISVVSGG